MILYLSRFEYLVKICVNILFKDLDLALFFILDIKTEKIIEKCPEKCPETANYYTTRDYPHLVNVGGKLGTAVLLLFWLAKAL